jgi:DNA-binding transcriptional LysR family regulator
MDDPAADALEVRFLRVLVALAEEGSFTDAAVRLGTGQPTVSRTLARFEAALGVRLVRRTTRSVELTPHGRAAYAAARDALAALDAVVDAARGRVRPLRLGYAWAAFGPHTVAVLRTWRERHPEVAVEVHRIDERSAGLRTGAVDVAIRRDDVSDPALHVAPIFDEGRVAAVPATAALAAREELELDDLADELVALSPTAGTTTLDLWPAGARPRRVVEVTNTDEWLMAIATGDAVGVTAASTAAQHPHPGVRFVPMPSVPGLRVCLVWPVRGAHPSTAEFAAVAREVAGCP